MPSCCFQKANVSNTFRKFIRQNEAQEGSTNLELPFNLNVQVQYVARSVITIIYLKTELLFKNCQEKTPLIDT